jgi:hypothetical protein
MHKSDRYLTPPENFSAQSLPGILVDRDNDQSSGLHRIPVDRIDSFDRQILQAA